MAERKTVEGLLRWLKARLQVRRKEVRHESAHQPTVFGEHTAGPSGRWIAEWVPVAGRAPGCRRTQSYWVLDRPSDVSRVLLGFRGAPPVSGRPLFYINGDRVYREEGHPDGASSVPYFRIRGQRIYAAEGYPTGSGTVALFKIRAPRPTDQTRPVTVSRNRNYGHFPEGT